MSGICSEHKHHEPGCPRCETGGEMTNEEINKAIAEKVMGWRLREPSYESPQGWWEGSEEEYNLEDWNPYHRIDHAMMALEKFEQYALYKDGEDKYRCWLWIKLTKPMEHTLGPYADTPSAAISLALVEAVKEE